MEPSAQFILTVGSILLLGLFTSAIAKRTFLPHVTLLLFFGIIIGPVLTRIAIVKAEPSKSHEG